MTYVGAPSPDARTAAAVAEAHTRPAHHSRVADRGGHDALRPGGGPLDDDPVADVGQGQFGG